MNRAYVAEDKDGAIFTYNSNGYVTQGDCTINQFRSKTCSR